MKKFEKKIEYNISYKQNFVEYSNIGIKYLKDISKIIKKNNGGILIIDYGYLNYKMHNRFPTKHFVLGLRILF